MHRSLSRPVWLLIQFFRTSALCLKDQQEKCNSSLSQPRTGISLTVTPVESLKR